MILLFNILNLILANQLECELVLVTIYVNLTSHQSIEKAG